MECHFLAQHQCAGIKELTLNVAKASEAISNVDISTYLKKSRNCSEKSMILANGSCRIHSLSIIPQRKAIFGDSYLENGRKQKRSNHRRPKTSRRFYSNREICSTGNMCQRGSSTCTVCPWTASGLQLIMPELPAFPTPHLCLQKPMHISV